jgi:hypothetical protein
VPPQRVASLYAAPLDEFVRRRKALAAELQTEGRAEEGRAVRQLPKPSLAVWAINQAVRAAGSAAERFIALTEQLQRAPQDPAATGAAKERRAALDELVEAAEAALRRAGQRASQQASRRVAATLEGAVADRQARQALNEGRLTREYDAPGFEALLGSPLRLVPRPPDERGPRPADDQQLPRAAEAAALRRRLDAAVREEARLRGLAEHADRRVAELREQLREAEARSAQARRRAEEAAQALAAARQESGG